MITFFRSGEKWFFDNADRWLQQSQPRHLKRLVLSYKKVVLQLLEPVVIENGANNSIAMERQMALYFALEFLERLYYVFISMLYWMCLSICN